MKHTSVVLAALYSSVFVAGCGLPGSSAPNGMDGDDADGNLSAAEVASQTAAAAVKAVASILPVTDLQAIFEQGQSLPTCPTLELDPSGASIVLSLVYANGCTPARVAATSVFEGTVSGTAFISVNGFEFTMTDLAIDGQTLTGRIAGSFFTVDTGIDFAVNLNLVTASGLTIRGNATVAFNAGSGEFSIPESTLQAAMPSGDVVEITFSTTIVDARVSGSFVPFAGTATVEYLAASEEPLPQPEAVEFSR